MALGTTQPLKIINTRNLCGELTSLDVSKLYGLSRPVTGIALPFTRKSDLLKLDYSEFAYCKPDLLRRVS
jgi:hypothetical protein